MKTFDKKDVYSWASCEDAKQYIGKQGYFGDCLKDLQKDIEDGSSFTLNKIIEDNDVDSIFKYLETFSNDLAFGLFLPAEKVKEVQKEKTYRPFTLDEFLEKFHIGDTLEMRNPEHGEYKILFEGFKVGKDKRVHIFLSGLLPVTFDELFESQYEIKISSQWQPFGVEE